MKDTIYREDAIDAIQKAYDKETLLYRFVRGIATKTLNNLPSAERKYGEWYDKGSLSCRCSECGCKSNSEYHFCPNCGIRMEGGR